MIDNSGKPELDINEGLHLFKRTPKPDVLCSNEALTSCLNGAIEEQEKNTRNDLMEIIINYGYFFSGQYQTVGDGIVYREFNNNDLFIRVYLNKSKKIVVYENRKYSDPLLGHQVRIRYDGIIHSVALFEEILNTINMI